LGEAGQGSEMRGAHTAISRGVDEAQVHPKM
jgi:hypothetical protein